MFSYSADPSTSPGDAVRFLVGDTDEDEYFLEDEEISWQPQRDQLADLAVAAEGVDLLSRFDGGRGHRVKAHARGDHVFGQPVSVAV